MRTITDQQVAADGDHGQQTPGRKRDSVQPGSLSISLRVQYIVHARNGQGDDACRLSCGRGLDRGPQLALQLSRIGIDLPKLLLTTGPIEQDTIIEVVPKQCTYSGRVGGRQDVGPDVFCANRVGLFLLIILTLLAPAYGHRKLKPMMRPSIVSVAARIRLKSSRTPSFRLRRLLRQEDPIRAESHSTKRASAKTINGVVG